MNKEENMKLSAPWTIYTNQVEAMFKEDIDVEVEFDDETKTLTIFVNGQNKADAIEKLFPKEQELGNITVTINVVPANIDGELSRIDLFRRAFAGNPAVTNIMSVDTLWGKENFVVFKPKVVQYYSDSMFDVNGRTSTLYQNLAEELFGTEERVHFNTDLVD
jgi:hypothetical protein